MVRQELLADIGQVGMLELDAADVQAFICLAVMGWGIITGQYAGFLDRLGQRISVIELDQVIGEIIQQDLPRLAVIVNRA